MDVPARTAATKASDWPQQMVTWVLGFTFRPCVVSNIAATWSQRPCTCLPIHNNHRADAADLKFMFKLTNEVAHALAAHNDATRRMGKTCWISPVLIEVGIDSCNCCILNRRRSWEVWKTCVTTARNRVSIVMYRVIYNWPKKLLDCEDCNGNSHVKILEMSGRRSKRLKCSLADKVAAWNQRKKFNRGTQNPESLLHTYLQPNWWRWISRPGEKGERCLTKSNSMHGLQEIEPWSSVDCNENPPASYCSGSNPTDSAEFMSAAIELHESGLLICRFFATTH